MWPIHRKRKQIDKTITDGAETLDLLDKDLTVLNMLKELKDTINKELKETRRLVYE